MITAETLFPVVKDVLRTAMVEPTQDVERALLEARERERSRAQQMYDMYESVRGYFIETGQTICPDAGNLTFFISLGSRCPVDPELNWWATFRKAISSLAIEDRFYKPMIVDPLTREDFRTNCGINMPYLRFNVAQGEDSIEITASPKGGGAEPYSDYKVLMPFEGIKGIRQFVYDCARRGLTSGRTCPPNTVGIGIGGDAAMAADLAMQACVLRPVGSRHPVPWIARLEEEMRDDINAMGYGPLGSLGEVSVYDVHIEYSWGHLVLMPVAFNIQCFIAHRATVRIWGDGRIERRPSPELWWKEYRKSVDYYLAESSLPVPNGMAVGVDHE